MPPPAPSDADPHRGRVVVACIALALLIALAVLGWLTLIATPLPMTPFDPAAGGSELSGRYCPCEGAVYLDV